MTISPTNILIVEDEKEIRRFVRIALESEGWRVFESETLQRGLIEAGTRKPDLIILDLGLPDGDGLTYIQDLRQWSSIPIIVLSARSSEEDKVAALDAGADDYLSKPFGISELLARVRVALRRHSGGSQESPLINFSDRVSVTFSIIGECGQGDYPTPVTQPSLGAKLCRTQPLSAHLYGPPAAKIRNRPYPP